MGNKVTCRWTYATNFACLMQSCVVGRFKHLHLLMGIHPWKDKVGYLVVLERGDIGIGGVSGCFY